MDPADRDLERAVHEALRRLPEPRAPRSLAPRVMRAVMASAPPAVESGWRHWPLQWQLLALVVAWSMTIVLVFTLPLVASWIGALPAARTAAVLWQTFIAPIATPALVFTAVMCTASALLFAALKYVAWEGQETTSS